ncbi:MAG: hypothetical protein QOC76_1369 [Mycobacterium sp.]|jgi:hypothetical protein|nr:hypothetical protein [Mycobacterium sp.]
MTTLDTEAGTARTTNLTQKIQGTPAPSVSQQTDTAALITEQQVLLSSAAALAPTPARHRNIAHEFSSAVRTMFARPERLRAPRHHAQRFTYLENSAMSRAMDRL